MILLGYCGVYKQRTGGKLDGCATFFKESRFQLETSIPVDYLRPGVSQLDRDNIALLVKLTPLKQKSGVPSKKARLIIANTHLLFNPRRGDIKLAQMMLFLAEIDKLACHTNSMLQTAEKPLYYPTIVCGDFNSEPYGPLYKLLIEGKLRYQGLYRAAVSGQAEGGNFGVSLDRELLPRWMGITDNCQYVGQVAERKRNDQVNQEAGNRSDKTHPAATMEQVATSSRDVGSYKSEIGEASRESVISPEQAQTSETPVIDVESEHVVCEGDQHGQITHESVESEGEWQLVGEKQSRSKDHQPPSPLQSSSAPAQSIAESHSKLYDQATGFLSHPLELCSVYSHSRKQGRSYEREVTSHHCADKTHVDYIMYGVNSKSLQYRGKEIITSRVQEKKLKLVAKLALPTDSGMNKVGGLPNEVISSDHVILLAQFYLNT